MTATPGADPPVHPQRWATALRDPLTGAINEGLPYGGIELDTCWCHCSYHEAEPVAAEYWWLTATSFWLGLCSACCADWRERAVSQPDLQAIRITMQRPR